MSSIAIIDFETTGIDSKTCRPIEVALQFVDTLDFKKVLGKYDSLIYSASYPSLSAEVELLTGISDEALRLNGKSPARVFENIYDLFTDLKVEACVAYNATYDHTVYTEELRRIGMLSEKEGGPVEVPWLCAMRDLKSNYKYKCWKLSHLALDYGVAVDPRELHRASGDVELTRRLLVASGLSIEEILLYHNTPWGALEAETKGPWLDGGKSTDAAKAIGFTWETPRGDFAKKFPKKWVCMKKENEVLGFIESNPQVKIRRIL